MPIVLKSRREIEMMRRAGQVGHQILAKMREAAQPGVSTLELDELARVELEKSGGVALSLHYTPSASIQPIVQALVLTDLVIGVAVAGLLLAFAVQTKKRTGSVDPNQPQPIAG